MALVKLSTECQFHHVGMRVPDAVKTKFWYQDIFGFEVDREFSIGNIKFVWLRSPGQHSTIIEIIGGGDLVNYTLPADWINHPGFAHICLPVENVEKTVADLRAYGAPIIMDVTPGVESTGFEKLAFAADLWGNTIELAQFAKA
jgi:catechol 2,3-dioxygenase-like lactoylglutathione lyase family enzyme